MKQQEDDTLLSRLVRFVRNPGTSWSDKDQPTLDPENRYSKQMLKDMIERRRRNDFVRKREFDMLRKLRRDNLAGVMTARPSFFPSSSQNKPDERAKTIKKIDEIEAQMSQQWWKTKYGETDGRVRDVDEPNTDFLSSLTTPLEAQGQGVGRGAGKPGDSDAPTVPQGASTSFEATERASRSMVWETVPGIRPLNRDTSNTSFSDSASNAMQVTQLGHDPQMEEAAIRFANGDDDGAEAALLEATRSPDPAINGNQAIWMALFDFYRAVDRQQQFESASLDFANRFDQSAPAWYSIPASIRPRAAQPAAVSAELLTHWKCPMTLDLAALGLLDAMLDKQSQPWCLDWNTLVMVDPQALEVLNRLLTAWTDTAVKLRFLGAAHLLEVLKSGTVSGDAQLDPLWWRIRLQALRVMNRPEEFEVVALDYCVTYEVSPPSWETALCEFKSMDGQSLTLSAPTIVAEATSDSVQSSLPGEDFTDTQINAIATLGGNVSAVDLSGHIMGDALEMLDRLNAKLAGADLVVVLCARLIRLDFLAAGTLLNWVSAQQAEGRQVQFKDVHRLVAVFFNIVGITEHAKVITRKD